MIVQKIININLQCSGFIGNKQKINLQYSGFIGKKQKINKINVGLPPNFNWTFCEFKKINSLLQHLKISENLRSSLIIQLNLYKILNEFLGRSLKSMRSLELCKTLLL